MNGVTNQIESRSLGYSYLVSVEPLKCKVRSREIFVGLSDILGTSSRRDVKRLDQGEIATNLCFMSVKSCNSF